MDRDAFFTVHKDLPREGPGSREDVAWALGLAQLPQGAVICELGAGPGGDIEALLGAPGARVIALDKHPGFVAQAQARFADMPNVRIEAADMAGVAGLPEAPFDMIWSAGALYFLGLEAGPRVAHGALKPGGVLAFSEPCFFTDAPSDAARALWEGYGTQDEAGICAAVEAAGFEVLGTRQVPDAGWEAYYQPMEARIDALRGGADAALSEMLDSCADEAAQWRAVRDETGYLLVAARRG